LKRDFVRFVAWGTKLVVSVGGLVFVFVRYELWDHLPQLLGVHHGWLWLAVGFCFLQIAVAGLRWQSILRAVRLLAPTGLVLRIFYVTAFLNSFLPAGLAGDMIRVWLLRHNPKGLGTLVNSVLIDRIVAVLTLVVAAAVAQSAIWMKWGETSMTVIVGGAALILTAGVYMTIWIGPHLRLPRFAWLATALHGFCVDLRRVFLDLSVASQTATIAFAANLLLIAAVYSLGRSLHLGLGVADWLVAMPIVLLATALPISIGGWGTREIAMVFMLGLFGVPGEQAALISIEFGLCQTIASLVGAPIWLTLRPPVRPK
jgi:uncharacterized membrane protein YbhN (UPF0104 family)